MSTNRGSASNVSSIPDQGVVMAFARLDSLALGAATGTVFGLLVCAATLFLLAKGGDHPGRNLQLLGQYFIGYTVSPFGAAIGFLYGFVAGFVLGWLVAFLRNLFIGIYISFVKFDTELASASECVGNPSEPYHNS